MPNFIYEQLFSKKNRFCAGLSRNCRQRTLIAPFFFLLTIVLLTPIQAASAGSAGKIVLIDNASAAQTITIVRPGKKVPIRGKQGNTVFVGDTVKTGSGVKAQLVLTDKSVINFGAESTLRIKAFINDQAKGRRKYVLKVLKGTIRFISSKANKSGGVSIPWHDSSVAIETPVSSAEVSEGEFVATISPDGSVEVAVFIGNVSVRNSSLFVQGTVTLARNQFTHVQCGLRPDDPKELSQQRRELLTIATTIYPGKTYRAAQNCNPDGKYTKEDAARDITAGKSVADVFDKAACSGMTIDQMVSAAIFSGVDPSTVVYTAIQEGYSTEAVVASAITNGASLDNVVAAAITVGGDVSAIVSGATDAGASSADVAISVANASSCTATVFGYTTPNDANAAFTAPGAPVSLSDGGGRTPPASPSKP